MKRTLGVLFVLTICCSAPAYAQQARLGGTNIPSSVKPWYQRAVAQQQAPATTPAADKSRPSRVKAEETDCIACAVYSVSWQYRLFVRAVAGEEGSLKFQLGCVKYCD